MVSRVKNLGHVPAPLFAIIDGAISPTWRVGAHGLDRSEVIIAYREWADDPTYYERLVDGDPEAVESFRRNKALLDAE